MRVQQASRILATLAVASFLAVAAGAAEPKSTSNEAEWLGFDAASNTVKVKIIKPGKGPNKDKVKTGSEVTFNVIPTGSVLTRTSVAVNGVKGELTDIRDGKTVLIYWVPDKNKEGELFARKVDVVLSEEELNKRYGDPE